ncbi:Uncharacterised protein [Mycobacteroides abscessus subsp. abscessus]|nr:Uncharacterised protein [Mycobacteroides abscessus subsp. abscessus]SHS36502.1 Uncharacterised protein [Mycobacteroides abscessus subsp. abscessus]SHU74500.1 Uncharacterised protein [Mycobacteroides abscessus subsp. abscessus]SHV43001.1 Uncharacterised protein [Mycobacteroides abscessus subsp. abscessus]SIA38903.1 Uncharacterised protein [Mycobacteroides abscessus subsp. abscessus]
MEADEGQPEVELAQALIEQTARHLWEPEVDAGVGREHDGAEEHVVEVRDHEVRVGDVEVDRGHGQQHAGQTTEEERDQEADGEDHRGLEGQLPLPHGADPVEELDTSGNRDQERHEGEERQQHRAGRVHVVRPHRDGQRGNTQGRVDQRGVTEDRLAAEHREDLRHDAKERQRDDVDLGVPEEPEQVLPQQNPAVSRIEHVGAQVAVGGQTEQRGGQQREGQQHQHAGHQDVPGEDRHPEHRHTRGTHTHDRGDHVYRAQDGAQTTDCQTHDPQISAGARGVNGVGQRRVGGPAEVGGTTRGDEACDTDQGPEEEQPEGEGVQSREGDVGGADLQRQHHVREAEHDGRGVEQQHHGAVHGEQLVELLVGEELQPRHGQFGAHEQRHQATDEEEREARDQVHDADQLVIGGRDQSIDQRAPCAHTGRERAAGLQSTNRGCFGGHGSSVSL